MKCQKGRPIDGRPFCCQPTAPKVQTLSRRLPVLNGMSDLKQFAVLGRPHCIWAVGAVHGEAGRLAALHDDIGGRFRTGDRLVYLGNLIGRGPAVRETVDELLSFRRRMMSLPSVIASDIIYLRGGQEEMWQKLLQLQFAPNPGEVLAWMLDQGVDATLAGYGGSAVEGQAAARDGAVSLTRWTNGLRAAQRAAAGHDPLFATLKWAALTRVDDGFAQAMLFVNAGVDPTRPIGAQGDGFWWGGAGFSRISEPVGEFGRIVRGYDPAHAGMALGPVTVTLDGGAGFGGGLLCGCFSPAGDLLELIEV
jgi:hypothetical protein